MILAIIFVILGYKKAKENGRNGFLWAGLALVAFIGTQLITAFVIGAVLATYLIAQGVPPEEIEPYFYKQSYSLIINLVSIALSVGAGLIVLYFANKPPRNEDDYLPPPPPTSFGQNA